MKTVGGIIHNTYNDLLKQLQILEEYILSKEEKQEKIKELFFNIKKGFFLEEKFFEKISVDDFLHSIEEDDGTGGIISSKNGFRFLEILFVIRGISQLYEDIFDKKIQFNKDFLELKRSLYTGIFNDLYLTGKDNKDFKGYLDLIGYLIPSKNMFRIGTYYSKLSSLIFSVFSKKEIYKFYDLADQGKYEIGNLFFC